MDGLRWDGSLKQDNFTAFAIAIVLFALATSIFFTPLPVYLQEVFGGQSEYVYLAYILNSIGATTGYFLIRSKANSMDIRKNMPRYILVRSLLLFSLTAVVMYMFLPTVLTCVILVVLGFSYAMYYIMMLSLSMEIIPEGKAGLFDGTVGLGSAIGALAGPFIAEYLSYDLVFFITGVLFLVAFAVIKAFR
jgi:predicted MFS family arabinose efflux permease